MSIILVTMSCNPFILPIILVIVVGTHLPASEPLLQQNGSDQGRGIRVVVDGFSPKGVEDDGENNCRKRLVAS